MGQKNKNILKIISKGSKGLMQEILWTERPVDIEASICLDGDLLQEPSISINTEDLRDISPFDLSASNMREFTYIIYGLTKISICGTLYEVEDLMSNKQMHIDNPESIAECIRGRSFIEYMDDLRDLYNDEEQEFIAFKNNSFRKILDLQS